MNTYAIRLSSVLLLALAASACATRHWGSIGESWVGHHIDEVRQHWGEPDRNWVRSDGMRVYQYHLEQVDPTCNHYWVTGDQGVINGFYYEGECRQLPDQR
jgi:hypothetical protein